MFRQTLMVCVTAIAVALCAKAQGQDATALEEQYKTCARHSIPSEKCTPEIFRQLKEKGNAPLDPKTEVALKAAKLYQKDLKNPASMQLRTAFVTDAGDVCLSIGAQNGFGGMTVGRIIYDTNKGKWLSSSGMSMLSDAVGELGGQAPSQGVDIWVTNLGHCIDKPKPSLRHLYHPKPIPGTDVTEKVNQALKDGR